MHLFISYLWEDPQFFFMWLLVVVFAICCHEYMHARAALWQGDPTAADQGHLTLNPFKQMGTISIFMLAVLGLAWGKVPVDPKRMRHKYSDALVSFAGPATNLVLAMVSCVIAALVIAAFDIQVPYGQEVEPGSNTVKLFRYGAVLNFVLFVFNMIPAPGFDGWHILCSFFPELKASESQAIYFVLAIVLFLGIRYIDYLFMIAALASDVIIYGLAITAKLCGL